MLFYDKFTEMIELNDQHPLGVSDRTKLKRRVANANRVVKGIRLIPTNRMQENGSVIQKSLVYCYVCWEEHSGVCEKEAFDDIVVKPNKPHKPWVDPMGGVNNDQDQEEEDDEELSGGGGGAPGGTPTDPPTTPDIPWSERNHNDITRNAIGNSLNITQLEQVQQGSKDADKLQGIANNRIHAQRISSQSVAEAIVQTGEYFTEEAMRFIRTGDYNALGRALHPIMDAYAPPHAGFQIYDDVSDLLGHTTELFNLSGTPAFDDAVEATQFVTDKLRQLPVNSTQNEVIAIYNLWIKSYERYL